jgi:hypothetical protein
MGKNMYMCYDHNRDKNIEKKFECGELEKLGKTRVSTIRTETSFRDFMVMV